MGTVIAQRRRDARLTQEQLGEKLGVSHEYISRVETGKVRPSWKFLTGLANILDVPVSELLAAAGLTPAVSLEDERFIAELLAQYPELKELFELIRRNPAEIPKAVRILKAALEEE